MHWAFPLWFPLSTPLVIMRHFCVSLTFVSLLSFSFLRLTHQLVYLNNPEPASAGSFLLLKRSSFLNVINKHFKKGVLPSHLCQMVNGLKVWGCPPKITVFTLKQKAPSDNCCYELLWNKIDPETQKPYYFKDHVFLISAAQKLLRPFTSAAPVKLLSVYQIICIKLDSSVNLCNCVQDEEQQSLDPVMLQSLGEIFLTVMHQQRGLAKQHTQLQ